MFIIFLIEFNYKCLSLNFFCLLFFIKQKIFFLGYPGYYRKFKCALKGKLNRIKKPFFAREFSKRRAKGQVFRTNQGIKYSLVFSGVKQTRQFIGLFWKSGKCLLYFNTIYIQKPILCLKCLHLAGEILRQTRLSKGKIKHYTQHFPQFSVGPIGQVKQCPRPGSDSDKSQNWADTHCPASTIRLITEKATILSLKWYLHDKGEQQVLGWVIQSFPKNMMTCVTHLLNKQAVINNLRIKVNEHKLEVSHQIFPFLPFSQLVSK